ncbi:MAG TPA: hypothetical protein VFG87_13025, partial [Amycolatopsis sp.]|nr:hypothetical protein [Amycolatopsis sp.]
TAGAEVEWEMHWEMDWEMHCRDVAPCALPVISMTVEAETGRQKVMVDDLAGLPPPSHACFRICERSMGGTKR